MTDFEPEAINVALSLILHGVGPVQLYREGGNKTLIEKAENVLHSLLDDFLADYDTEAEDNPGAANGAF